LLLQFGSLSKHLDYKLSCTW